MKHPHGTFDNQKTMRRERWVNGELKFYAEAHASDTGVKIADYGGLFGRPEDQDPWGHFPDLKDGP